MAPENPGARWFLDLARLAVAEPWSVPDLPTALRQARGSSFLCPILGRPQMVWRLTGSHEAEGHPPSECLRALSTTDIVDGILQGRLSGGHLSGCLLINQSQAPVEFRPRLHKPAGSQPHRACREGVSSAPCAGPPPRPWILTAEVLEKQSETLTCLKDTTMPTIFSLSKGKEEQPRRKGLNCDGIYEDLVEQPAAQCRYTLTYKLSQNHLELFFSAIRAHGGYNNNPNVRQFQGAYKRLLVRHQPSTGIFGSEKHDFHARVLEVKLVQVFLHHGDQLDTADLTHVVAATVYDEDIQCCPSLQGVEENKGRRLFQHSPPQPNQQTQTSSTLRLLP
eukprot:superscaffoldBa00002830_g15395